MKSIIMLAGVGAFALMLCGCRPELDQSGLSPEEQAWAKSIKANYGAWEVPESVPRSVRRDDMNSASKADSTMPPAADAPAEIPAAAPVDPVAPDTRAATAPNAAPEAVAPAAVDASAAATPETYTVVKGDTLGGIARKFYGKASAWKRIQDANADLLKGKTVIRPGMKLQIPRP